MGSPTPNLGFTLPENLGDQNSWGPEVNGNFSLLDLLMGGIVAVPVGGGVNVTATVTQAQNLVQRLQGVVFSNIFYLLPATPRSYIISNETTGGQTITVAVSNGAGAALGTGVVVPQGGRALVYCDGTNIAALTPIGTAGGDLGGTFPSPVVDGLQGRSLLSTAPTTLQSIGWNGTAWAPMSIATPVYVEDGVQRSGLNGNMPGPTGATVTSSMGDQFLSASITPLGGSAIIVECLLNVAPSGVAAYITAALFQDANTTAIDAALLNTASINLPGQMYLRKRVTSFTPNVATTFKVRAGLDRAGTLLVNGNSGQYFSSLSLREVP
jgi:hypothetical protein